MILIMIESVGKWTLDLQEWPLSLEICVMMFLMWKFSSFFISNFFYYNNPIMQEKKVLV
jgi:hypothetical protein